jgi:hypothetical protein
MLERDAEPSGSQSFVSAYADIRTFPPYFESPPVAAGTSVAAAAAGTGVLADVDDVDDADDAACGVSVSDDPHATATINKIADTIGSKTLRLSILCLDM